MIGNVEQLERKVCTDILTNTRYISQTHFYSQRTSRYPGNHASLVQSGLYLLQPSIVFISVNPILLGGVSLQLTSQLIQPGYRFEPLLWRNPNELLFFYPKSHLTPSFLFSPSLRAVICQYVTTLLNCI